MTEENEPSPPVSPEDCKDSVEEVPASRLCCLVRYAQYLRNIWRWVSSSSGKLELDINDSDFVEVIAKIKRKKHYTAVLPPQREPKKVLVLDLDETLIHTTFSKPAKYDFESEVVFNGRNTKIFTVKRFGLDAFLFEMSKLYEIVVFTASQKLYADKVLDLIDPKRRIAHRLYREHCIVINKSYYLKNMRILGRNLSQLVVVDVLLAPLRTTTSPASCSLRTSTRSSPTRAATRTASSVDFPPSSSTSTTSRTSSPSATNANSSRTSRSTSLRRTPTPSSPTAALSRTARSSTSTRRPTQKWSRSSPRPTRRGRRPKPQLPTSSRGSDTSFSLLRLLLDWLPISNIQYPISLSSSACAPLHSPHCA